MFPINFNFPYRKKDGSIITMEKALDGAGADLDLIDLDDVAITTPADGDGLIYDNTAQKWKNIPIISRIIALFNGWKKNGAYNLCPNNATTQVVGETTFTVNSDGTILVDSNGTAITTQRAIRIDGADALNLKAGNYVICGIPEGISGEIYINDSTNTVNIVSTTTHAPKAFTVNSDYNNVIIGLVIKPNQPAISSKVFKPMITTDPNAAYADYVPYAMTNRELTEDVTDIFKSKGKIAYSSLNSPFNAISTSHGIDYKKVGNLLYITGHAELSSVTFNANTGYTIATLPAGFRPYVQHRIAPFFTNGYNAYGDKGIQISIGSDGAIQLFGASSVTVSGALWFNAVLFTSAT